MSLPEELKNKWITALRSGEYNQCKQSLHEADGYCCLGVLGCEMGLKERIEEGGMQDAYDAVTNLIGNDNKWKFIDMNDFQGKTFPEIADVIESDLTLTTSPTK